MTDPQDMLGVVRDSPGQWQQALETSRAAEVRSTPAARAVVVAGMGGSGIAGNVAALAADQAGTLPVVPVKGYAVPAWVGQDTPVIAVSHSGNTEETLAFVEAAASAGAIGHVVTSGGELGAWASDNGWSATVVPGGLQPRASLPSLVTPVLLALHRWGVLPSLEDDLARVPDALARAVEVDRAGAGVGRTLAAVLSDGTPVFLGGRGVGSLVALRAACQVAENAEEKAFHAELPEFDHNALVGFATPADDRRPFVVTTIVDPDDHPRVAARVAPTVAAMRDGVRAVHELTLPEGPWLHRLAAGILDVDLASVHLALALGRDPTPVEVLVDLKRQLAGTP